MSIQNISVTTGISEDLRCKNCQGQTELPGLRKCNSQLILTLEHIHKETGYAQYWKYGNMKHGRQTVSFIRHCCKNNIEGKI